MATRHATPRQDGAGPTAAVRVAARDAVRAALAAVRPLVSQSRDGLTLILLEPRPRVIDRHRAGRIAHRPSAGRAMPAAGGWEARGALPAPAASPDPSRDPARPAALVTDDEVERADAARAFTLPSGTTGVAVGVYDRIVSLELFDEPGGLAGEWPRVVDGAVGSWLARRRAVTSGAAPRPERRRPDDGAVGRLLRRSADALDGATVLPASGAALSVLIDDVRVAGSALVVDGRPVHVELSRRDDSLPGPAEAP